MLDFLFSINPCTSAGITNESPPAKKHTLGGRIHLLSQIAAPGLPIAAAIGFVPGLLTGFEKG
jgi:hypothetical protein